MSLRNTVAVPSPCLPEEGVYRAEVLEASSMGNSCCLSPARGFVAKRRCGVGRRESGESLRGR
jgi:hypothetical protein